MDIILTNKYKDMESIINKFMPSQLTRREVEIKRDSSMEYFIHPSYGWVASHRNCCVHNNVPTYMKAHNRFVWCPRKSYKHN